MSNRAQPGCGCERARRSTNVLACLVFTMQCMRVAVLTSVAIPRVTTRAIATCWATQLAHCWRPRIILRSDAGGVHVGTCASGSSRSCSCRCAVASASRASEQRTKPRGWLDPRSSERAEGEDLQVKARNRVRDCGVGFPRVMTCLRCWVQHGGAAVDWFGPEADGKTGTNPNWTGKCGDLWRLSDRMCGGC